MAHPYNEILLINMMNEPQKHDVTIYCMVLLMSLKRQNVETESRSYVWNLGWDWDRLQKGREFLRDDGNVLSFC